MAGSVALAVSQILAHHVHPTNYPTLTNSNISQYSGRASYLSALRTEKYVNASSGPGTRDHSSLVATIVEHLVNSNWRLERTSAYTSNVPSCLYKLGYQQPTISAYGKTPIRISVVNKQPVYIGEITNTSGGCVHAWVIDGYKEVDWSIRMYHDKFDANGNYNGRYYGANMTSNTYYFHSNFGMGGEHDGFFMESVFDYKPYMGRGMEGPTGPPAPILQIIPHIKKQPAGPIGPPGEI